MNGHVQFNWLRKIPVVILLVMLFASLSIADNLRLIREKSFPMKDWQGVYVNASGADVKVESWDKQEVYVKIFGNSRAESKMQFDIYQEDDAVKVIAKKRGSMFNWFGNNISVRIEIMTPKNYNPHIETSGGDISVKNLVGEFRLDTSGGDITLTNTNGKLKAETSGGDITLNTHKGNSVLSTSGGDIKCKETIGDLNAETSGGDINIDLTDGKLYAETSGGDITINYTGSNKGIDASTSGGSIHVKLPSNFAAKAHLETSGGEISNNFTNSKSERVRRSEVDAEFNGGGGMLKLETTGGDIIVDQK
ncbi:MAG: DUF4097 family beta strand repeat-containing protein [Ignavibacteriales bacterium]|nr:DUF4097 family beta strand repeat-containing protein [Ignavibacteriales bacterium]